MTGHREAKKRECDDSRDIQAQQHLSGLRNSSIPTSARAGSGNSSSAPSPRPMRGRPSPARPRLWRPSWRGAAGVNAPVVANPLVRARDERVIPMPIEVRDLQREPFTMCQVVGVEPCDVLSARRGKAPIQALRQAEILLVRDDGDPAVVVPPDDDIDPSLEASSTIRSSKSGNVCSRMLSIAAARCRSPLTRTSAPSPAACPYAGRAVDTCGLRYQPAGGPSQKRAVTPIGRARLPRRRSCLRRRPSAGTAPGCA
jgi:hypothetical protein